MNAPAPARRTGSNEPMARLVRLLGLCLLLAALAAALAPAEAQQRRTIDPDDGFSDEELGYPPDDRRSAPGSVQSAPPGLAEPRDERDGAYVRDGRGGYSSEAPQGRFATEGPAPQVSRQSSLCRQLESELASDWVRGQSTTDALPQLNNKIRQQEETLEKLQDDADRQDCYENMFIFGRSLRKTKKCIDLDDRLRDAKRLLGDLKAERASIRDSRNEGSRRNRLLEELARNDCGDQYRYEARRSRSNDWFGGGGFGDLFGIPAERPKPRDLPPDQIQPYATYRTVCVRLCDGFYYPVSFSTLPNNFPQDADACRSGCAAPAELFVYRNPGGEVEQMISPDGRPYDSLANAWRFRKEFIQGCSCKPVEYSEADIAAHEAKAAGGKGEPTPANAEPTPDARPGKSSAAPAAKAGTDAPNAAHVSPGEAKSIEDLIR